MADSVWVGEATRSAPQYSRLCSVQTHSGLWPDSWGESFPFPGVAVVSVKCRVWPRVCCNVRPRLPNLESGESVRATMFWCQSATDRRAHSQTWTWQGPEGLVWSPWRGLCRGLLKRLVGASCPCCQVPRPPARCLTCPPCVSTLGPPVSPADFSFQGVY